MDTLVEFFGDTPLLLLIVQKSGVENQLRWRYTYPIIYQGFIHLTWLFGIFFH